MSAAHVPSASTSAGINADGTAVCQPTAFVPELHQYRRQQCNVVGLHTSIAIGSDGLPVISHQDSSGASLKVAHCANAACAPPGTINSNVDFMFFTGCKTSIAIGTDGFPVLSYYSIPGQPNSTQLKVAKCVDIACATPAAMVTFPPIPGPCVHSSIAIGTDGFPVISYHSPTFGGVYVVKCGNARCTPNLTITTVDDFATNPGSASSSIVIGADGSPVISYHDSTNGHLKVAKC